MHGVFNREYNVYSRIPWTITGLFPTYYYYIYIYIYGKGMWFNLELENSTGTLVDMIKKRVIIQQEQHNK